MVSIRHLRGSARFDDGPAVEIAVSSERPFPALATAPVMRIGERASDVSRYPPDGDMHTLVFVWSLEDFERLTEGEHVIVQYGHEVGSAASALVWDFGPFSQSSTWRA